MRKGYCYGILIDCQVKKGRLSSSFAEHEIKWHQGEYPTRDDASDLLKRKISPSTIYCDIPKHSGSIII